MKLKSVKGAFSQPKHLQKRPTKVETRNYTEFMTWENKMASTKEMPKLKSLKAAFVKWDEEMVGHAIEGRVVDRRHIELKDGAGIRYTLDTGDGRVAFIAPMQVAEALEGVPYGVYVRVTYNGEMKGNGTRKYKDFTVEAEEFAAVNGASVNHQTGEIFDESTE